MSLNSYNLTKQSVVYGMFNQYVFSEVKTNIDLIERYFLMDVTTMSNGLIKSLLDAVRKYDLNVIDEPLFRSILASQGKTDAESTSILQEIVRYKMCDTHQIDPIRKFIRGIGSQALLDLAAKKYPGDPEGYIKFLRTNEYKADYSDMFSITNFDNLDINSVMADSMGGWKSSYEFINKSFQPMEKYENGQIIMVCMPPGCFTEDTKVIVKVKDVECLKPFIIKMEIGQLLEHNRYHQYLIETYNEDTKSYEFSEFECYFTRNAKNLIKVSTSEGDYKCTPDHKWLTEENGWIRADKLTKDMHLLGIYSNTEILGIEKVTLDKPIPVYDISIKTNKNNHTFRLGCGAVVHNCGKTLFMINECLNMCIQGARCHYLALGDMNQKDFVQRMGAIYSGLTFGDTMRDLPNIFSQLKAIMSGRFNLTILPAAQTTVDEYIEYMIEKKDEYDVLFIDYDSNFRPTQADNMYKEGGYIYDNLTKLTKAGKLVFCATQPKIGSWRNETIELTDAGESSRKQHNVDIMITGSRGGLTYNPNHLGIMKIAKNRRGEEGIEAPYIRLNNGRFRILPQSVYTRLKGLSERRDFTDGDIDQMIEADMAMRQGQMNQGMSTSNVGGPAPIQNSTSTQSKKGPTKPIDPNYNPLAAYFNQNPTQP